jgi:hypothetical protein
MSKAGVDVLAASRPRFRFLQVSSSAALFFSFPWQDRGGSKERLVLSLFGCKPGRRAGLAWRSRAGHFRGTWPWGGDTTNVGSLANRQGDRRPTAKRGEGNGKFTGASPFWFCSVRKKLTGGTRPSTNSLHTNTGLGKAVSSFSIHIQRGSARSRPGPTRLSLVPSPLRGACRNAGTLSQWVLGVAVLQDAAYPLPWRHTNPCITLASRRPIGTK